MEQLGKAECFMDEMEFGLQGAVDGKVPRIVVKLSGVVAQVKGCVCHGVTWGGTFFRVWRSLQKDELDEIRCRGAAKGGG